jgi:hypothetical protein
MPKIRTFKRGELVRDVLTPQRRLGVVVKAHASNAGLYTVHWATTGKDTLSFWADLEKVHAEQEKG